MRKAQNKILYFNFLIAFLFLPTTLSAQFENQIFQTYDLSDGISNNIVMDVTEDEHGFLWISTHDGLNKFDGYNFTVYRYDPDRQSTISSNKLMSLHFGANNNLWLVTNKGIDKFNLENEYVTNYSHDSLFQNYNEQLSINTIADDDEGNTWFGTSRGLLMHDALKDEIKTFRYSASDAGSLSNNQVYTIFCDSKGRLWIGTQNGLNLYENNRFYRIFNTSEDHSISTNKVECIAEDNNGNIWIGGWGLNQMTSFEKESNGITAKFKRYNNPELWLDSKQLPVRTIHITSGNVLWIGTNLGVSRMKIDEEETFKHYLFEKEHLNRNQDNAILKILEDQTGNVWLISNNENGLYLFDQSDNKFDQYLYNSTIHKSLPSNSINALTLDRSNNLWISTTNGLSKLNLNEKQFQTLNESNSGNIRLNSNLVFSIEETDQFYLIGTSNGINRFSKNFSRVTYITDSPNDKYGLATNKVSVIKSDPYGFLWVGYLNYKASKYFYKTDRFEHFHFVLSNPDHLRPWSARTILIGRDSTVWMGFTSGGLIRYSRANNKFEYLTPEGDGSYNMESFGIHFLFEDTKEHIIWIGSRGKGLFSYHTKLKEWKSYTHDPQNSKTIYGDEIWYIHQSKREPEILWVGTNLGLNRFNKSSQSFSSYSTEEGLPGNVVKSILEDKNGSLWIGTGNGLAKFDPESKNVITFGPEDGNYNEDFNNAACYHATNGTMFFGGNNGLTIFNPDSIELNTIFPKVVISGLKLFNKDIQTGDTINGKVILKKSINYTNEITLTYKENDFSLQFTGLNFSLPDKLYYSYKLDGYDKDWKYTDSENRFATYTNLPPDEYTFMVRASNNSAEWPADTEKLTVIVEPPFWKSIGFKIFLILIILIAIPTLIRLRTMRIDNQRKILSLKLNEMTAELEENHKIRYRFFTNISHELRTPLTLIMHPAEKIMADQTLPEAAKKHASIIVRNANRLLKMVNQLLDFRKLESGLMKLHISQGSLTNFTQQVFESFENLAQRRNIDYKYVVDKQLEGSMQYFDNENLEKILFNLLSNAFKFTPDEGSVKLELHIIDNKTAEFKISDSGIGIPAHETDKIFERFHRVESGQGKRKTGTGIGLALTKELVDLHHGKISVSSIEGSGTTFSFQIPVEKIHYHQHELSNNQADIPRNETIEHQDLEHFKTNKPLNSDTNKPITNRQYTILIVDDNPDIREIIFDELAPHYHVLTASDGKSALEITKNELPHLIISDILMPEMNGNEFCQAIKQNWITAHIPIIMLTALSSAENQLAGLESGADDYITKPFQIDILKAKIKNHLEHYSRLKQWLESDYSDKTIDSAYQINSNIGELDKKFIDELKTTIESNLVDPDFDISHLSKKMKISRMHLHRKLVSLFGVSASDFLRTMRLKHAANLLKKGSVNASEAAYACGFNDPSNFSKAFKKQFGLTPGEFLKDAEK